MKLDAGIVSTILQAANVGCILGIEGLKMDKDAIRGYNVDNGVMLLISGPFDIDFESLGIARLPNLKQKFKLISGNDISVEAIPRKGTPEIIEKLDFRSKKFNFEFRCALAKSIKDVPSLKLNNAPLYTFELQAEDYELMTKSASAMRSKNMTIQSSSSGVNLRFSDDTGDILNCRVDTEISTSEDLDSMSLTVNLTKMLPIFRLAINEGNIRINILKNNIVYLVIENMDIYVMPEV